MTLFITGIDKTTEDGANVGLAVAHAVAVWLEPVQTPDVAGAIKNDLQSLKLQGKRPVGARSIQTFPYSCYLPPILICLASQDLTSMFLSLSQDTRCMQRAARPWRMRWPRGRGRTAPGTATRPSTPWPWMVRLHARRTPPLPLLLLPALLVPFEEG